MSGPERHPAEVAIPARAELGEGPIWDGSSQTLLWVDILVGHVHRFWPDGGIDVAREVGSAVTAVGLREAGGLILALQDGVALVGEGDVGAGLSRPDGATGYAMHLSGERLPFERLPAPVIEADRVRFNDAAMDPEGCFLAGTMDWREEQPLGSLYQVAVDGAVRELLTGVTVSNGIDISEDGRTLYYVDSAAGGVTAFQRNPETGDLRHPQRLVEVPTADGVPDGLTLDAEGCLWVAVWGAGQVRRFSPEGILIGAVEVPAQQVSSVAFGGSDLAQLFITTARVGLDQVELAGSPRAGDVFWCDSGTTGRPAPRFQG